MGQLPLVYTIWRTDKGAFFKGLRRRSGTINPHPHMSARVLDFFFSRYIQIAPRRPRKECVVTIAARRMKRNDCSNVLIDAQKKVPRITCYFVIMTTTKPSIKTYRTLNKLPRHLEAKWQNKRWGIRLCLGSVWFFSRGHKHKVPV